MKKTVGEHPTAEQLEAFVHGRLSPAGQEEMERHVAQCHHCSQVLAQIPEDTLLGQLRAGETAGPPPTRLAPSEIPKELQAHPRYRVVKRLGAGGMGMVFQAEHRLMERAVALKVINTDLLDNPAAVERFHLEFKAVARLTHPNIVTAFDADQAGNLHFLVMELVDGVSLARLVEKRGPLPVTNACHYIRQAAQGLQHAFTQGMVHRDIKPQNLMLTRQGQVKVLDFGLARLARAPGPTASEAQKRPPVLGPGLTQAGAVLGTPDYMAPEQAHNSRDVDIRADIYSLGCTLYFLLKGAPPFPTGSALQKMVAHSEDSPPALTEAATPPPPEVIRIVERMMAKDPAQRFQTPAEVVEALAPFARPGQPKEEDKKTKGVPARSVDRRQQQPSRPPQASQPAFLAKHSPLALRLGAVLVLAAFAAWGIASWWPASQETFPGNGELPSPAGKGPIGVNGEQPTPPTKAAAHSQRMPILVVLAQEYQQADFGPLAEVSGQEKWPLKVASTARTPCQALKESGSVKPDLVLTEDALKADDYAALVFPGGNVWAFKDDYPPRQVVWRLLSEAAKTKKCVAAIDRGLGVLAVAGTLKGKKAALNPLMVNYDPVKLSGAHWVQEPVVRDDWLITAATSAHAPAFARAILQALQSQP